MKSHRTGPRPRPGSLVQAASIGALATGAAAVGACAIGALAVGSLAIRKMRVSNLAIEVLRVGEIRGAIRPGSVWQGDAATRAVAEEYVALCRSGAFEEAMARFFAADHIRVESVDMTAPPTEMHGVEEMRQRSQEFAAEDEIHGAEIDGPFVGGEMFAVRFSIDSTYRPTGKRTTTRKLDLYTVRHEMIVRSEVYYNTPPLLAH
jgi:hypothetical protein